MKNETKQKAVYPRIQTGSGRAGHQARPRLCRGPRIVDINVSVLRRWEKEQRDHGPQAFPGTGHQLPELEEIARLKRELKRAHTEIEILKKATALPCAGCVLRQGNRSEVRLYSGQSNALPGITPV